MVICNTSVINKLFYNMESMIGWMKGELDLYLDDDYRTTTYKIAIGMLT